MKACHLVTDQVLSPYQPFLECRLSVASFSGGSFFFFNAAFLYVIKLYCETIPLVTPLLEFRMEEAPWAYLHEGRFSAMVLSVPAVRTTSVGVAGTRDVGPLSTKVVFELNKCTESAFLQS